jgi:hypothetical protein
VWLIIALQFATRHITLRTETLQRFSSFQSINEELNKLSPCLRAVDPLSILGLFDGLWLLVHKFLQLVLDFKQLTAACPLGDL